MDTGQVTLKKERVVVIATLKGKVLLVQQKSDSLQLWRFPRINRRPEYKMAQSACACLRFLHGAHPIRPRFTLIRAGVDTGRSIIDVFKIELTQNEWLEIERRSVETEQRSSVGLFKLNELGTLATLKAGDRRLITALGGPPPSS